MTEEQRGVVPERPVVIERVDGRGQGLQDAVHDAGHQAAHIGAQVQVGVPDEALHHVEKPVELLQVVTHRLHLRGGGGGACHGGVEEFDLMMDTSSQRVLLLPYSLDCSSHSFMVWLV